MGSLGGLEARNNREESGSFERLKDNPGAVITDRSDALRRSITDRLTRPLSRISSLLVSLTQSGRLKRVSEDDDHEHMRQAVKTSLEDLVDGVCAIGAMAEAESSQYPEGIPHLDQISRVIAHTVKTMYDHPFFQGLGPTETILIEETPESIVLARTTKQGLQNIDASQLFNVPEEAKEHLDTIIAWRSCFLGKHYDIACYLEREAFETLQELKNRASTLNKFFGGLIRAFYDALDAARAPVQEREQPSIQEDLPKPSQELKITHEIARPHFPPPTMEQARQELQRSEQLLADADSQFDKLVESSLQRILAIAQGEAIPGKIPHHIADTLPAPTCPTEELMDELYRIALPGSAVELLNPRTFLLNIIEQWATQEAAKGSWTPEKLTSVTWKTVLAQANPGKLILNELTRQKAFDRSMSQEEQADELGASFGLLAEVATTALFPIHGPVERVPVAEILVREHLVLPDKPFSFSERITGSPILEGAKPTTEDKLCRLLIGLFEAFAQEGGFKAGGISGLFYFLSGHLHEARRWVKQSEEDQLLMTERCHWLQGAFEQSLEGDDELQTLAKAVFGLLQVKTKDEWNGIGSKRSVFELLRKHAQGIPQDKDAVDRFKKAYDQPFLLLENTIGSFLDDPDGDLQLDQLANALHAYWHTCVQTSLPLVFAFMRNDPRLRGHFARSYTIENIGAENLVSFLHGWQAKTGSLTLPHVHADGTINAYVMKSLSVK